MCYKLPLHLLSYDLENKIEWIPIIVETAMRISYHLPEVFLKIWLSVAESKHLWKSNRSNNTTDVKS